MGFEHADSGQITGLTHARISAVFQEDRLCEAFTPLDNVYMAAAPAFTKAQIREELLALLPEDALAVDKSAVPPSAALSVHPLTC